MSSGPDVYMDIPAVRDIAKNFNTFSEVLNGVVQVLEALINTLNTIAFISDPARAARDWFDRLKPQIQELAEKMAEISKDVDDSVTAYQNGDAQGATRFY